MERLVRKLLLWVLGIFLMFFLIPESSVWADNWQEQIDATQQNKNELEQIMDAHEKELKGLKGEQSGLQKRLGELNTELTEVSNHLADLEAQIVDKLAEIAETRVALAEAKEKEAWQYDCMRQHVKYSYERGSMGWLEAIFQAESFASILNYATYFEGVASYSDRMLDEIIGTREFIESEEARLEQENQELEILKINAEAEKSRVNELIQQVSKSISQYEDQIDDAEAEARAYEAEMKKLENDLKYLKKKLAEEQAMSQLAANGQWRNISEVTFAEGDRYLLANLIYCEAGGEPYAGQVAVGSVVINRVLSDKFPDTVVGVIYQKRQFSPVGSGRLELALAMNKATPSCYKAADEAMAGLSNVGNCVFFRTPIPGLTGISIGGHIFY
ncbi:MAG: cell wall hydrolase [Lachnospiraceae bacterium]|nr:cell wall hydrolase [Lachnospiraceae bacterium]